ncbi:hypothetical protein [Lichenicoccus sp.]|uniref:hypothetical protein n=1 Tax=Lichenicoccus sp. TaxID=2781899 RepID=UPI003D130257
MSDTLSPLDTQPEEERIDEGVEETFPASDPPATGGSTGPDDGRDSGDGPPGIRRMATG